MFLKCIFNFCSLINVLCFCLVTFLCFLCFLVLFGAFCAFWCFWCVQNLFVKKNKEFKAALITSFILLLSNYVRIFFSCFIKVCNIQNTQYSKTIWIYYWFLCTPQRGGFSFSFMASVFVLLIVWNYIKGLYNNFGGP